MSYSLEDENVDIRNIYSLIKDIYCTSPISTVWMNIEGYNRLEIEILKWSLPYRRARCTQIALGIRTVYTKDDLLGFEHAQSADLLSAALPNNRITFKLRNEDDRWNPDNPQNAGQYLMNQQEMRLRYGMDINGAIEWIDGGVFWLDEWNIPSNGVEASFTARDELTFMHAIYTGPLSGTLYEIADAALQQANLPALSTGAEIYALSPVLHQYTTDVTGGAMDNTAISAVLQMVAHAANCVLFQDRLGTIRIEPWNSKYKGYMIEPFSKPKEQQKYQIPINNAAITRMIRKIAGWSADDGNWNIPGVYLTDEKALVYDLKTATKPRSKGGGWAVKRQREAEAVEAAEAVEN